MRKNAIRMMVSKSKDIVNDELKGRVRRGYKNLRDGLRYFVCHVPPQKVKE